MFKRGRKEKQLTSMLRKAKMSGEVRENDSLEDGEVFSCEYCGKTFFSASNRRRHERQKVCTTNREVRIVARCESCDQNFSREDAYNAHCRRFHPRGGETSFTFACGVCNDTFSSASEMAAHRELHRELAVLQSRESAMGEGETNEFVEIQSAHEGSCEVLRYHFPPHVNSVNEAIEHIYPQIRDLINRKKIDNKLFKVQPILNAEYVQIGEDAQIKSQIVVPFRPHGITVRPLEDFRPLLKDALFQIVDTSESFTNRGSGWTENEMCFMDIEFTKSRPMQGSCSLHEVGFRRKQGVEISEESIPTHSRGKMDCFYLAVASHFISDQPAFAHLNRAEKEQKAREYSDAHFVRNLQTPVKLNDIGEFEEANRENIDLAINVVYKDEEGKMYPVRASPYVEAEHKIILFLALLTSTEVDFSPDEDLSEHHYAYVDSPSMLFASRKKSETDGKTRTNRGWFCFNCFNYQWRRETHLRHVSWCHQKSGQRVIMPQKGQTISYNPSPSKSFRLAYLLFFDFETLQKTPKKTCRCEEGSSSEGERPAKRKKEDGCPHKTKVLADHVAFSYSYLLMNRENEIVEESTYVGDDAAEHFLNKLLDLEGRYLEPLKEGGKPMLPLDDAQKISAEEATECYLCGKEFEKKEDRVRDHDHLTGLFLGVAHNICNLRRRENIRLVTFAHNFSGFDSHILIQAMGQARERIKNINAIPLNTQKFKMLQINRIIMLDSAAFLPDALSKLVDTLVASNHPFPLLSACWGNDEDKRLLLRKGVYPYSFATSIRRLEDQKELPPAQSFFNEIGETEISASDYRHAKEVWSHFKIKNMLDYTRLYVRSDVYLLAEVVVNLRDAIMTEFGLEIAHYLSLPMLTKDIMLKTTDVEMELISDQEMAHLIQSNIRGGLSYINTRLYDVNAQKRSRSIAYLDANNLYGYAMCFPMPLRDFSWMSQDEIKNFDCEKMVSEDDGPGYMLEVTLDYPEELHLEHNSFPLAPEHIDICEEDLSPYSRECLKGLHKPEKYRAQKLTSTFRTRKNYLVHGLNLQFYLRMGMKLVEIHRGIKFYQEAFLRPYIVRCMKKRAAAKTKSESDLMKMLSNSLYGKMIEGGSNRMDCKFNYTKENAIKHFSDPLYKGFVISSENFSITFHKKKHLKMKQSWAVGFSVLELSKLAMQRLMYEKVKPAFGGQVSTLMTDTDSWILVAPCSSPDKIVKRLKEVMDFSNYAQDHSLYSASRKNKVGYLKNEVSKDTISEFVGIRSKTYAFKTVRDDVDSRAKGVKKCYKKKIGFETYKKCIREINEVRVEQCMLTSKAHQNMLVKSEKTAFSSFDDKRYLLCAIHSVPYGSVLIRISMKENQCYFCKRPNILV